MLPPRSRRRRGYPLTMEHAPPPPARPRALLGWRALALFYDLWPALALWFLTAVPFMLVDAAIHGDVRHNIEPFSLMQWLLWLTCWAVAGLYTTISWRRGGQTLGMRPWRLRLAAADGTPPGWGALWLRYLVGTASLRLAGRGFFWAWSDRDGLPWHERASNTRLVRTP